MRDKQEKLRDYIQKRNTGRLETNKKHSLICRDNKKALTDRQKSITV